MVRNSATRAKILWMLSKGRRRETSAPPITNISSWTCGRTRPAIRQLHQHHRLLSPSKRTRSDICTTTNYSTWKLTSDSARPTESSCAASIRTRAALLSGGPNRFIEGTVGKNNRTESGCTLSQRCQSGAKRVGTSSHPFPRTATATDNVAFYLLRERNPAI